MDTPRYSSNFHSRPFISVCIKRSTNPDTSNFKLEEGPSHPFSSLVVRYECECAQEKEVGDGGSAVFPQATKNP